MVCADVARGVWELLPPMAQSRSGCCAAFGPDGRLLVAGGFDGQFRMSSTELYDPAEDSWCTGPPLLLARSGAAMAVEGAGADSALYVVGGTDGHTQHNSVERLQYERRSAPADGEEKETPLSLQPLEFRCASPCPPAGTVGAARVRTR